MEEIKILMVEDNEGDIILMQEALREARIANQVMVARDGQQALDLLQAEDSRPDLILLDINLPKVNGLEVLATIKKDASLQIIPVIILTTSSSDKDILASYANHANCFINKPVDLESFMEIIRSIESFWISIVRLPKK